MSTPYNKAIVAAATPIIVWLAARYGLALAPDEAAALVTLITTLTVYVVPNKQRYSRPIIEQAHTGPATEEPLTLHREEDNER